MENIRGELRRQGLKGVYTTEKPWMRPGSAGVM